MQDKSKKKKQFYDKKCVERLYKKYGVSKRYVHMCLDPEADSDMANTIKADYKKMDEATTNLLNEM